MGKMKKVWEKYEKRKHSKVKCFLHILGKAEIHTVPKSENMGIVNSLSTGKLWENTNIPKVFGFLYIPHYSIPREIKTHTIPKT